MSETLSQKARRFAVQAHGDQKYGERPYSVHLDAVADLARPYGEYFEVVAYLHDVLEDTSTTFDELQNKFGTTIAKAVQYLSDPEGSSRKERKARLHRRLEKLDLAEPHFFLVYLVLGVKACDRLANLREASKNSPHLYKMYAKEHKEFRRAARRPGLCDEIWSEIDLIMEFSEP